MFRIGAVTDEIAPSAERAFAVAAEWELEYVELRSIRGRNVADLPPGALRRLARVAAAAGLPITVLNTYAFRCDIDDRVALAEHFEHLRRAVSAARTLNAPTVSIFAFWRSAPRLRLSEVRERLAQALEITRPAGVTLALENTSSCNVATTAEIVATLDDADSNLRLVWDPANAVAAGERAAARVGYERLRSRIVSIHVKDVEIDTHERRWRAVGDGCLDAAGLINTLARAGYDGCLTLDTHWRLAGDDGLRSTERSLWALRRLILRTSAAGGDAQSACARGG